MRSLRAVLKFVEHAMLRDIAAAEELPSKPDATTLTDGYLRELNALRNPSSGDRVDYDHGALSPHHADGEWEDESSDPLAEQIQQALAELAENPAFCFEDQAYTVRRAAGSCGLEVTKVCKE